jgi:hypothetical protein
MLFLSSFCTIFTGLSLHGVLEAIQRKGNRQDALRMFVHGKFPSAEEMGLFFKATFSEEEENRAIEEMIVYNLKNFFKKVERKYKQTEN